MLWFDYFLLIKGELKKGIEKLKKGIQSNGQNLI